MGRTLMYTALGALLILVLSATFVLDHGGAQLPAGAASDTISLHDLTSSIERYRNRTVKTTGTLYFNSATNNFVIVDGIDANYPVTIDYGGKLGDFEGKRVLVVGTFDVVPGEGPTIAATNVELDATKSPATTGI